MDARYWLKKTMITKLKRLKLTFTNPITEMCMLNSDICHEIFPEIKRKDCLECPIEELIKHYEEDVKEYEKEFKKKVVDISSILPSALINIFESFNIKKYINEFCLDSNYNEFLKEISEFFKNVSNSLEGLDCCPICNVELELSTTASTSDLPGYIYVICPNCLRRYPKMKQSNNKFDFFDIKNNNNKERD